MGFGCRISEGGSVIFTRSGTTGTSAGRSNPGICADDFKARMSRFVCPARTRAGSEGSDDFLVSSPVAQQGMGRSLEIGGGFG